MSQSPYFCMLARFCCGLMALASAGCQTYPPYGYGGYPGNNGYPMYGQPMYGQPGQVMPYNGNGVMPGGTIAPSGQPNGYPSYPAGGAPPFNSGTATPPTPQVPRQDVDKSGDSFGPAGQFPESSSSNRPSLPPDDPEYNNPKSGPSVKRPAPTSGVADEADFKGELNGAERATQKIKAEDEPMGGKTSMLGEDGIEFTPPVTSKARSAGGSNIVQTAQHVEAAQNPNVRPYGRAANGHGWFRGLVDFDKQENTWYLIYNPEPEISDQLGGMITLIDHPQLESFSANDVALVEGVFDLNETDANGNAKYRITTIRRLVP